MRSGSARTASVKEVATLLGVSPAMVYKAAAAGELPAIRIGGRILILRSPLERLLRGASTTPIAETAADG